MPRGFEQTGQLRLVHSAERYEESVWFCGRCATPAGNERTPAPSMRVCRNCGLGLLLETRADLVPSDTDAFLVVDSTLAVEAMSERAERLLGLSELQAVHNPLREMLVPASVEAGREHDLVRSVIDAVAGAGEIRTVYVRPADTFGVRMRARIGVCGPPRAALVVLETGRPALRSV